MSQTPRFSPTLQAAGLRDAPEFLYVLQTLHNVKVFCSQPGCSRHEPPWCAGGFWTAEAALG